MVKEKLIKRLSQILRLILVIILSPLATLAPRNPRRWAFGCSNNTFSGNPKYLYLWMLIYSEDIDPVWITGSSRTLRQLRSIGVPVHKRWSLSGVITALRSGVFIYSHGTQDINFYLSPGAIKVNLWHGVGLKALSHHDRGPEKKREIILKKIASLPASRYLMSPYIASPDILVTTSEFTQNHFSYHYDLPPDRCPKLGYPRMDCSFEERLASMVARLDANKSFTIKKSNDQIVYLYMPTFRDSGRSFFREAIPDPKKLSHILKSVNAVLYIKPHPNTLEPPPLEENILSWPNDIDFQPYLPQLAGLITDYSSVLYDYLFVGKGTPILYTFDLESYKQERTLSYDYEENVAGILVKNFEDLCCVIETGFEGYTLPKKATDLRSKFWGGVTYPASPAIYVEILHRLALR